MQHPFATLFTRRAATILISGSALIAAAFAVRSTSTSAQTPKREAVPDASHNGTRHIRPIHPPIIRPPWPIPTPRVSLGQELRLIDQKARVSINGGVARTRLEQTFENPTGRTIEGTYLFPLPEGAAISDFAMTVNGKRMAAGILDGDKAREIYTGIVQKMRGPAILEFIDRNLVRARIFPIAAGDKPKIELEYAESLKPESAGASTSGSFRYVLPLRLPVGGVAQKASVDVEIQSPQGLRAIYSPTHAVDVKRDGNRARLSGEWNQSSNVPASTSDENATARDFVLYFTTDNARVGVSSVTYAPPGEDGYFMMLVAPDADLSSREIAAKDVVFVCDTSGSMSGEKIEQARRALTTLLGNLNANDRFGIVTFSSDTRRFRDSLQAASSENLNAARSWIGEIKAVGGTNINDALLDGLQVLAAPDKPDNRARQIVFMTDGQPTVGETDVAQILKNIRAKNLAPNIDTGTPGVWTNDILAPRARLFAFGDGFDVNTRLLDTLAEDNRGSSDYVLPKEDIETKVGSLYSKIAFPVLSNPRLDWGGLKVYDVYPRRLPDLFRGTQAVVFGRYEGRNPNARVQLIGNANGREERIAGNGNWSGGEQNDLLPRLWAMRKVGYLAEDARNNNRPIDGEVREEIIRLSKKYGIVTPLTAALITEDSPSTNAPISGAPPFAFEDRSRDLRPSGGFAGGRTNAKQNAAPAAPFSTADAGAGAAAASKARREMREAERVDDQNNVRHIDGKAFFLRDGVWIDGAFDAAKSPKPQQIAFGSAEYLQLLRDKKLAKWLSVGARLILVLPDRVVEITAAP